MKNISLIFILMLIAKPVISYGSNIKIQKEQESNFAYFNQNFDNYEKSITIYSNTGLINTGFRVAVANNDSLRAYGLMNLRKLPQTYGMLFLFDDNQHIAMWMRNTLIPLDMIFIDNNNQIIDYYQNAKPKSDKIIEAPAGTNKVLEINAGLIKKLGIKKGFHIAIEK
ncbi:MAG: DUF192 domain-containing protein [Rickettsiales bacterium]|nr:DUF192 domain-containing protein [Rickettsiales bacterium]